MEPRAEAITQRSDDQNKQAFVLPDRPHLLTPGSRGKEQIGNIVGNPNKGKPIYLKYCTYCHGKTGRGDGIAAIGLKPSPANLSATFIRWGPLNAKDASTLDQRIFEIITYGLKGSKELEMPAWGPILSKQDRADVLAYIKLISTKQLEKR